MADINTVIETGRLTKDPELKKTPQGISVVRFAIAVSDVPTRDGQQVTDFIQCVAWRNNADFLSQYCKKGEQIAVEGKLKTRHYKNQNGQEVYFTEVVAETIVKTWEKKQNTQPVQPAQTVDQYGFDTGKEISIDDDNLPF